jgi:hypothetical protein
VRAVVIGAQDPGLEIGLGTYFPRHDHARVGYEITIMMREHPDAAPAEARELHALYKVSVGW